MKKFLWNNGLSIATISLFLTFLCGESIAGYFQHNQDLSLHHQSTVSFSSYLRCSDFWEPVFENWESEFLEMAGYVFLTAYLVQKGSAESKNPDEPSPKKSHFPHWTRRHPFFTGLYAHSLSLALLCLFAGAFTGHVVAGGNKYNDELAQHGKPGVSRLAYAQSAQFWFESLQNWQSEFLGVSSIILLSIWFREKGSPESKTIGSANSETGR